MKPTGKIRKMKNRCTSRKRAADIAPPPNDFKVPKKQWQKWNSVEKWTFVRMFALMKKNPWMFDHPKYPKIAKPAWETIAWNVAWIAADMAGDQVIINPIHYIVTDDDGSTRQSR